MERHGRALTGRIGNDRTMERNAGLGRYVLKFISGKYQGGEFALEPNQELIIGRSSDLEMVLIEDMVSRQHARITTTNDEIIIEDLGSTNGTFVNGEKITRCKLKEGDRILIGTSIIKLVYEEQPVGRMISGGAGGAAGATQPEARAVPTSAPAGTRRAQHTAHGATQSGVLSGVIDQVPLPDLLQLFATSKKTGGLFITTPNGMEGCIYLREGRVYGAVINRNYDVPVEKACYRIMTWTSGTFLLDTTASYDFEKPIDETVESMLMESMRIIDETHAIGEDVPAFEAVFKINIPLGGKLRDLSPEQLDVFQLLLEEATMEHVLNHSDLDDIEASKAVVHLIRNGYISVEPEEKT